ncbi:MAG: hypothetical protein F4Y75_03050 [Acidimicrobiia bacterium]|nr:hypothetical protein [Acidimicrobiia bacterium]MYD04304.1 hypothetical protein [Acidimicrobiia bacterium]
MVVRAHAEVTVEPFIEGRQGPHVQEIIKAFAPLKPDIGPFGTSIEGGLEEVISLTNQGIQAAMAAGATRVVVNMTVTP